MKISISVPDDLAREIDQIATEFGRSRSFIYSVAAQQYVGRHSERRARLDTIYGPPVSSPPSQFRKSMARSIRKSRGDHEW